VVHSDLPSHPLHHRVLIQILQSKFVTRGSSQVKQVLVKWSGRPIDLATWEDAKSLQQKFPHRPAWGQAGVQARRNVNTAVVRQELSKELPRRSCRPKKPNMKYDSPNWLKPKAG
jgi:hypothetical protein